MTREELFPYLDKLSLSLISLGDELHWMRHSPRFDEDYKVERDETVTKEFFDELTARVNWIREHCYKEGTPFR